MDELQVEFARARFVAKELFVAFDEKDGLCCLLPSSTDR